MSDTRVVYVTTSDESAPLADDGSRLVDPDAVTRVEPETLAARWGVGDEHTTPASDGGSVTETDEAERTADLPTPEAVDCVVVDDTPGWDGDTTAVVDDLDALDGPDRVLLTAAARDTASGSDETPTPTEATDERSSSDVDDTPGDDTDDTPDDDTGDTPGDDTDPESETTTLLSRLHEATRTLMRADDPQAVARAATAAADDVLGFPISGVRLYDADAEVLRPVEMSAETDDHVGSRPAYSRGEAIHWTVFDEGESRYLADVSEIADEIERSGSGSVMYLPLGEYGVFSVGRETGGEISDRDRWLAELLAANTTVALDRADRERRLREREGELADKNDRLERFADAAAHDIRNPLNVVAANVDIARESADVVDHDPLAAAADAADRMAEVVDRYLTLARHGRVVEELETVSVATVAETAWATVATDTATLRLPPDDYSLEADPERLRTLFENLFRNAVEHAGPDVRVTVAGTPDATGFLVRDDGPGFGDTDPTELFEPGGTGRDSDGFGIGLASVERIAEAHGWTVTAADADDGGAVFRFETDHESG